MIAPALVGCSTEGNSSAPEAPGTSRQQPPQTPPTDTSSETPAPETAADNEPEAPSNRERETPMEAIISFSQTGNTEGVAERLASLLGIAAQAITPAEPYTSADIDYNSDCRANREQQDDPSVRPALAHRADEGGGQILLVTDGEGWYQEWGQPVCKLLPGDVVTLPANVKHWHGAAADSWMSHVAFEAPGVGCANEWCEPVVCEEYAALS